MSYQWGDIDQSGTVNQFFVDYLDSASALKQTQDYKHKTFQMLGLKPGHRILDVGCGAGDDLMSLAHIVGPKGFVSGVDNGQVMVDTASRRTAHLDWVDVQKADGTKLPFPDASFDACRSDRVFIHMDQPEVAMDEMLRVLKPGGRILIADPEYDTLALDARPSEITRKVVRHLTDENRNPFAARHNNRLFRKRNLEAVEVWPSTAVFHDLETANRILGFMEAVKVVADDAEAEAWLKDLQKQQDDGHFLCAMTGLATVGRKPL